MSFTLECASYSQLLSIEKPKRNFDTDLGRCEGVLQFMGREVKRRQEFRMKAVKWVVTKLQGENKNASFRTVCNRAGPI